MIALTLQRELTLRSPPAPGRARHVSAASGLVRVGTHLYVVADDENHLGVFAVDGHAGGDLLRLVDGSLPDAPRERKKHKPDFEALILLPAFDGCPFGALFALGSGSKKRRHKGVLVPFDALLLPLGTPRVIDLSPLHETLARELDDLNIEGAAVTEHRLVLLQRGNDGVAGNACIDYALGDFLQALARNPEMAPLAPQAIHHVELGTRAGVTLGFTDATALPDGRLLFSAVAERTDNSYLDGECVGAVVGMLDRNGQVLRLEDVTPGYKLEGITADTTPDGVRFLAVTDADDAAVPARLVTGLLPGN